MTVDDKSENADGQQVAADFAARLRARAEELRISRSNLLNWTGIKKQTFSGYWNGERLPPSDVLFKLADQLDVDGRWLLFGERPPGSAAIQAGIRDWMRNVDEGDQRARSADLVDIAEIDLRYGMGATYLDSEVEVETRSFSRAWLRNFTLSQPEELFWARGQGDSMGPTIADNDILLIDRRQNTVLTSDLIWAFAFGQVGMIKRLRPMPDGSVKILSDNAAVPPETAVDDELHIVGRVVAIVKRV
ncbi:S24 family peptidase [Sphingomonas sp.]|uniref:XRE family transcriptional regulator n=1 Tax=Sphingomonas sp. TaxID=28214 RepID=UPI00307F8AB0